MLSRTIILALLAALPAQAQGIPQKYIPSTLQDRSPKLVQFRITLELTSSETQPNQLKEGDLLQHHRTLNISAQGDQVVWSYQDQGKEQFSAESVGPELPQKVQGQATQVGEAQFKSTVSGTPSHIIHKVNLNGKVTELNASITWDQKIKRTCVNLRTQVALSGQNQLTLNGQAVKDAAWTGLSGSALSMWLDDDDDTLTPTVWKLRVNQFDQHRICTGPAEKTATLDGQWYGLQVSPDGKTYSFSGSKDWPVKDLNMKTTTTLKFKLVVVPKTLKYP